MKMREKEGGSKEGGSKKGEGQTCYFRDIIYGSTPSKMSSNFS